MPDAKDSPLRKAAQQAQESNLSSSNPDAATPGRLLLGPDIGLSVGGSSAAPDAAPERGTGPLLAFERASGIALPAWVGAGEVEACGECHRCVETCPARALELRSTAPNGGPAATGAPASLFLLPGSCIGCADCVRVCPASLRSM